MCKLCVEPGCPVARAFGSLVCGRLDWNFTCWKARVQKAALLAVLEAWMPIHNHTQSDIQLTYNLHTTYIQPITQVLCSTCELALGAWLQNAGFKINQNTSAVGARNWKITASPRFGGRILRSTPDEQREFADGLLSRPWGLNFAFGGPNEVPPAQKTQGWKTQNMGWDDDILRIS